jgi:hypothetical protein
MEAVAAWPLLPPRTKAMLLLPLLLLVASLAPHASSGECTQHILRHASIDLACSRPGLADFDVDFVCAADGVRYDYKAYTEVRTTHRRLDLSLRLPFISDDQLR